jgi:hypothetical protein
MEKLARTVALCLLTLASCSEPPRYTFHATTQRDFAVVFRCDTRTGEAWLGVPNVGDSTSKSAGWRKIP